ncbi:MAG TPA: MFS transporter [Mycobacteriales bacterium]|jgi:MFS family permease|nr:MFS transporter [Mycobacteriales bacterium]
MRATVPAAADAPAQGRGHALRAVLRRPDFRRLYGTRLASQCADGVFQASLAGVVLFSPESAADPADIAGAFAALLLPYSFVGPFAGVLLDRWRRQRVLMVSNVVRCVLVGLVALEIATATTGVLLYATALLVTSVNRFFLAAQSAAQPHVVEPERLVTGNALSTTSGSVIAVLGGGIALLLQQLVGDGDGGYAVIALASVLGYGTSAFLARKFAPDQLGPDDVERSRRETLRDVARGLVAGGRHVAQRREVVSALTAIGAHRFFYGISTISTLLLYRNYFTDDGVFQAGLAGLGQVFAATAAGTLIAASVTPAAVRRFGKHVWVTGLFAAAAVTEIALGVPYTMQTLLPAALLLGIVAQASKISVDTLVQEQVEDDYRGRVFSLYDTLFNVTFVAAAVAGAFALPISGKSYFMLGVVAGGYAVTAVTYRLAVRRAG